MLRCSLKTRCLSTFRRPLFSSILNSTSSHHDPVCIVCRSGLRSPFRGFGLRNARASSGWILLGVFEKRTRPRVQLPRGLKLNLAVSCSLKIEHCHHHAQSTHTSRRETPGNQEIKTLQGTLSPPPIALGQGHSLVRDDIRHLPDHG